MTMYLASRLVYCSQYSTRPPPYERGWHVKTTLRDVCQFSFPGFLLIALTACGGGSNDQSPAPTPPPTAQSTPVPPPMVPPESGDAWQGRYVGTVTIGDVQYFADAMLTADGLIRLYVGGPYDAIGSMPVTVPASSAQLIGTLRGRTNQISGDGLVFGQQCAGSDPIRFCGDIGQANISIAVASPTHPPSFRARSS
jgi:hypothetical protein